jgi:hypothetical protein
VAPGALVDPGRPHRGADGLLDRGLVEVEEDLLARHRIRAGARGREEVLPGQARRGVRHFLAEGVGQVHLAATGGQLEAVPLGNALDLRRERVPHARRKQRGSVVLPLAATHRDLAALEVHVLDPDGEALEEAKAAAIEDLADEPERGLQVVEEGKDLAPREDGGEVMRAASTSEADELGHLQAKDAAIEEDERAKGLVLGGRGDATLHGEVVEERGGLDGSHVPGVASTVEHDKGADPLEVRLLRARRVMKAADGRAHGFKKGHG